MKPRKSESPSTRASPAARLKALKPGMRALEACGDGFWECDLVSGSAWFNDWFYRKLGWPSGDPCRTFGGLEAALHPMEWSRLLGALREHLEKGLPFDLELEVQVQGTRVERWHMRGAAQRNAAGQPVYLAGNMRELCDPSAPHELNITACLGSAFEALPVAAALLDSHAMVIVANQLWREFPTATVDLAVARLRAANSQTAIEFWLDEGAHAPAGSRPLRVRAVAFQHEGSRHVAVTLEDRRND